MESIYNLVPEEYVEPKKPPMYRSKHDPKIPPTGSTFGTHGNTQPIGAGSIIKKDSAMFGPNPKDSKQTPKDYLKAGTGNTKIVVRKLKSDFHYDEKDRKPKIPTRDDKPIMGLKTAKQFITANAVEAILSVPRIVDKSEPNYLKKADYGKVPSYLGEVKEEIKRENDMIDAYVREQMGMEWEKKDHFERMDDMEREDLLNALKAKWDATNARYQQITHIVKLDSRGKVRRKEELEKELKQLEEDIAKLERQTVLVET